MDWFDIVKNPKLRTGGKVTTNLGSNEKVEENSCNQKLKEYVDKVNSYMTSSIINWEKETWQPPNKNMHPIPLTLGMVDTEARFAPVPESVACLALKELNNLNLDITATSGPRWKDYKLDDYIIHMNFNSRQHMYGIWIDLTLIIEPFGSNSFLPDNGIYISALFSISHKTKEKVDWFNGDEDEQFYANLEANLIMRHIKELSNKYANRVDWRKW